MARRSDILNGLPIVSAENFVESEFEDKFVIYAQRYGLAGKELELGREMTTNDFEMPDGNRLVEVKTIIKFEQKKMKRRERHLIYQYLKPSSRNIVKDTLRCLRQR